VTLNVNVNPVGDWTTQAGDPLVLFRALGPEIVKKRAAEGDREAQFSEGYRLLSAAGVAGMPPGVARSPQEDVGLALCTAQFPVAHQTEVEVSLWSFACLIKQFSCGMPTLSGGGHKASGEGGGARTCVRYGGVGIYSPREAGA
jgi:hypothetical protein